MKNIERMTLIDRIGRELQSRMSVNDISTYLRSFGINPAGTFDISSKWIYTKQLLAESSAETVLRIADELGIPHGYTVTPIREVRESNSWEPNHFRLFVTHLSSFKVTTAALQAALRSFAVSAFVAHVDIEPTKEWQDEIESALYSMDALAAILMPGFKESNWTDQEVGFALGRGILIIPIMRGLTPYGFLGKYQGLKAERRTVAEVARALFDILSTSHKTRNRLLSCLVDSMLASTSDEDFRDKLDSFAQVKDIPALYFERLRDGARRSSMLIKDLPNRNLVDSLLVQRGLTPVAWDSDIKMAITDEDIPF